MSAAVHDQAAPQGVRVRGPVTSEELAAVLAVVAAADRQPPRTGYRSWRATRLAALRATLPDRPG